MSTPLGIQQSNCDCQHPWGSSKDEEYPQATTTHARACSFVIVSSGAGTAADEAVRKKDNPGDETERTWAPLSSGHALRAPCSPSTMLSADHAPRRPYSPWAILSAGHALRGPRSPLSADHALRGPCSPRTKISATMLSADHARSLLDPNSHHHSIECAPRAANATAGLALDAASQERNQKPPHHRQPPHPGDVAADDDGPSPSVKPPHHAGVLTARPLALVV